MSQERPVALVPPIVAWYHGHARDLPWRRPDASAWGILVSELMLQQTPVSRVLPAYRAWLERWPTPADLAVEPPGEAVRQWGRLGYPRRALWLHASARAIVDRHAGQVPSAYHALRALPGVGAYTAAAVAVFAYRRRHAVLDTNVRRLLSRAVSGRAHPGRTPTAGERRLAESALPDDPRLAARWSVAAMELGALVCTARAPRCDVCPVAGRCAWRLAGRPGGDGRLRTQRYEGTDRQARGRLLAILRETPGSVTRDRLDLAWQEPVQRERALAALVHDGLAMRLRDGTYALPGPR